MFSKFQMSAEEKKLQEVLILICRPILIYIAFRCNEV